MSIEKRKYLKISLLMVLMLSFCFYGQTQSLKRHHIYIIDKTGSMVGLPVGSGNANIWDEVKLSIISSLKDIDIGEEVTIYTYHERVEPKFELVINSDSDRNKLIDHINSLRADGSYTCTYKSLDTVLKQYSDSLESKIFKLYTDGTNSNDYCGNVNLFDVMDGYRTRKGEYDFLLYITCGFSLPTDEKEDIEGNEGTVISTQNGVPKIIDIIPKNPILKFSKEDATWEQYFKVLGEDDLPENFNIVVDDISVTELSQTGHSPIITPSSHSVIGITKYEFRPTNAATVSDGVYNGELVYQKVYELDNNVFITVHGNKIKIEYSTYKRPLLEWNLIEK